MAISEVTSVLPPLYARWIDALLAAPIPPETRATCDDCAMCAPDGAHPDGNDFYFSPRVKCCSYQPNLPNYLVGRALEDRDFAFSAGRATLERRIDAGVGVTPLGLGQYPRMALLYANSSSAFGRADALRCPHYLAEGGGRCGIWRNRNSICATWFCKHERGNVGLTFWNRLRDLLMAVEASLAAWCVLESDVDAAALEALFPIEQKPRDRPGLSAAELDERVDPNLARQQWGKWLGAERQFYRQCGERVEPLTWRQVERIGGSKVTALARITRKAFDALLSEDLPDRLTAGPLQILPSDRDGVCVVGYSGSDPLDLDPAVMEILPYFDGRPTRRVLEVIEEHLNLRVEEDLLRRLADFKILVPPEADPT